jgi:hypothetical protein
MGVALLQGANQCILSPTCIALESRLCNAWSGDGSGVLQGGWAGKAQDRWWKRKRMEGIEAHRHRGEGGTTKLIRRTVVMARGCRETGARRRLGWRWS